MMRLHSVNWTKNNSNKGRDGKMCTRRRQRRRTPDKVLPLRRAAGKMKKKRIVAREPLPVFAMLDTCFSMAVQPERGGFTSSDGGTHSA